MADNFDSNVARRKPNTAAKRPILPWDIPHTPPVIPVDENLESNGAVSETKHVAADDSVISTPHAVSSSPDENSNSIPSLDVHSSPSVPLEETAPAPVITVRQPSAPAKRQEDAVPSRSSRRGADLSDSINIHSNFCKLDNDISDHLMRRLSASSQSVFLRLYRQSYGWNRNWAAESLPKLCEFCNLSLQTVRKAIKELETIGCIRKEFRDYHKAP